MLAKSCEDDIKADLSLQTLSPSLQDSIKNIIEKTNYAQYKVTIKEIDTLANNLTSKLYEIDVIDESTPVECQNETNIFVKQRVDWGKVDLLSVPELYSNEEFFYRDLSNIFTTLQDQANVPQENRYKIVKAYDGINDNAIILENLAKKGFQIYNKMETISIKHAELAVQELAKFHALSFAIESKMPEYYERKIKVLDNPFHFDENWKGLIRNICAYVANLYVGEVKRKIEKFVPVFLEKLPKYYEDRTSIKCTLTHGDYKKNNLLFRMKDGEPVEVVVIDYQMISYGCPIRDFFLLIFTGSDREFRRKHLNDLKELYFKTLSRFLKYFDMDVEIVYPRKEFDKVYTEWLDFGLMAALFASMFIFIPDTGLDLQNLSLPDIPYSPDKTYEGLIRGLIDDFIEWGYL